MLNGIYTAKGYAIGTAVVINEETADIESSEKTEISIEKKKLKEAIEKFISENEQLSQKLLESAEKKESEIILGHNAMLKDPYMISEIESRIMDKESAKSAIINTLDKYIEMFSSSDDDVIKNRATDIRDIKSRLVGLLNKTNSMDLSKLKKGSVIVINELTPSMAAAFDKDNIAGIIAQTGSKTSHSAILTKALGIPTVLSVDKATQIIKNDDTVIIDAVEKKIIINPDDDEQAEYIKRRKKYLENEAELKKLKDKEAVTKDGIKIRLYGNVRSSKDVTTVLNNGGEGVGLFRSEFLFMDREDPATEEEQFQEYKKAVTNADNKAIIIRTLDIGGDKTAESLKIKKEDNPFMGLRALRYCLKNTEVFKTQLRAILRASAFGDISIMIPLVTEADEFRRVKNIISDVMRELDDEKTDYRNDIKIGVMIETPSAAVIADVLAREADFFSIGTNDLTGYTLGVDRGNKDVEYLYSPFSPSVLRLIKHTIDCAKKADIPCGMCGETASDEMMIPLLIAFGIDELSVSSSAIASTKQQLLRYTKADADKISEYIMSLDSVSTIKNELKKIIEM